MATLQITNLSEQLLDRLRHDAQVQSKEISEVAADRLASAYGCEAKPNRKSIDGLLKIADETRSGTGGAWLTPEFIRAAREDGRK